MKPMAQVLALLALGVPLPPAGAAGDCAPAPAWHPGPEWREQADARIRELRSRPVRIELVDAAGAPLAGVPVRLRMRRHAFEWGAAVPARLLTRAFDDSARRDQEIFRGLFLRAFNAATLENALKWTAWEGEMSADGAFAARAFFGQHVLEADLAGRTRRLPLTIGPGCPGQPLRVRLP